MKSEKQIRLFSAMVFALLISCSGFGQISLKTTQQIQQLISEKKSRNLVERKISSQLLQAIREASGKQMVQGLALMPANVNADSTGSLLVDINANATETLLGKIKALGGQVIYTSAKFHALRVKITLSSVKAIAALPGVNFIKPATRGRLVKTGEQAATSHNQGLAGSGGIGAAGLMQPTFKQRAERVRQQLKKYMMMLGTGSATTEGDHTSGADSARKVFGCQGQGIRIGVLSDSYNVMGSWGETPNASTDVATGDLPGLGNPFGDTTPVTVLQDYTGYGASDEGRAMLQIVHDIAPKAQLFFATAFISDGGFADNILALRAAPNNCDIIIDDVIYYNEPAYQDGIIAQAVNSVTASGCMYFSSAGNGGSALKDYASIWEGDFNDNGSPLFAGDIGKTGSIHNFGTIESPEIGDTIKPTLSAVYTLKWADPIGGSSNDYDLFIVTPPGNIIYSSTNIQDGTQDPYEEIDLTSYKIYSGYQLLVFKNGSAKPVTFVVNANTNGFGPAFKHTTQGLTYGHSAAANAFSVAAAPAVSAYLYAFTGTNQVEFFSSDGPRHIFFNADSTPVTPGNFLIGTNGGTVRQKPDITSVDGVATSMGGFNPFYGTSAAAPHAGAIAALVKSANPALTTTQIRNILTSTALDIEAPGYDINSGYGIVQAYEAVKAANPKLVPSLSPGQISITEDTFSNHNGSVDPGETGNMVVQLLNQSLANANNVFVTIGSSSPGITIARDSAWYGNIAKGKGVANDAMPFKFAISSQVACGTKLIFYIRVSFDSAGKNAIAFTDTITAGNFIFSNINSTIGQPPLSQIGVGVVSGQQKGRLNYTYYPSYCNYAISDPGTWDTANLHQFDAYTFTNISKISKCVTVSLKSAGYTIFSAAYDSGGFVPSNLSTHLLGEAANPAPVANYNFTVAGGAKFTVVVSDANPIPASGTAYSLNVSYTNCTEAPPCTPAVINPAISVGASGVPYNYFFTASGGSGTYAFSISGALPPGMFFKKGKLFGEPTQAGRFPIVVTLSDPLSCNLTTSINDTIVISGIVPDLVNAFAGTPQTSPVKGLFADALQAKVFGKNKPLPGVNVIFTAPANLLTPSGTFTGGVDTVMVITDSNGIATAPAFTADSLAGSYTITASVNGVANRAKFSFTNTCLNTVVTNNADDGPGSLRYIVANACPAALVAFAPGISKINLTTGEIPMFKSVSIIGPGADKLTISGSKSSRVFRVAPVNTADSINIAGMAIVDGLPQGNWGGGGIYINGGTVSINSCLIANNDASFSADEQGGGIFAIDAHVTVTNSSIVQNAGLYGAGGIGSYRGYLNVYNSTVANNISSGTIYGSTGGGIYSAYGVLKITNSTIYGNTALTGANIYGIDLYYYSGRDTLQNTIVAGGIIPTGTGGGGTDLYGTGYVSLGYNLIQDTTAGAYSIANGFASTDIKGVDPNLLPLANYGGTTPTLLPAPNSPVVNKGDVSLSPLLFDQRGYTRVAAGLPDIGAVEANYTSVTNAGTPQSAAVNTTFGTALKGKVTESGKAIKGVAVIFRAPASSAVASGTFAGGSATATDTTNNSGIATAPAFTANANTGTYIVFDSIGSAFSNAGFSLTNTKALAVSFGHIVASVSNCTVQISWNTLTGQSGETFGLERSTDGVDYTPLYTTPGNGTSNTVQTYKFTDESPAVGSNYYRVKQTDANGTAVYSPTIIAVNTCSNAPIIAYPNPVHSTLTLIMPGTEKQEVSIYDQRGRLVVRYATVAGRKDIDVSHWAGGTYTVTVVKKDKTTFNLKVVKN